MRSPVYVPKLKTLRGVFESFHPSLLANDEIEELQTMHQHYPKGLPEAVEWLFVRAVLARRTVYANPGWKGAAVLCCALLLAAPVSAQTIVKNPRQIKFVCPDHALDTDHEVDIVASDGTVVQTLRLGDPEANASGFVTAPLNVQPVAIGRYTVVVRPIAGGIAAENSLPSNEWERTTLSATDVTVEK